LSTDSVVVIDLAALMNDEEDNIEEQLTFFASVANSKYLNKTPLLLLFNKIDIFKANHSKYYPEGEDLTSAINGILYFIQTVDNFCRHKETLYRKGAGFL
jgi:hypothetical protein